MLKIYMRNKVIFEVDTECLHFTEGVRVRFINRGSVTIEETGCLFLQAQERWDDVTYFLTTIPKEAYGKVVERYISEEVVENGQLVRGS